MSKTRRGLSFVLCLVMVLSLVAGIPIASLDLGTKANAETSNTNPGGADEWVTAWHTSMVYLNGDSSSNISTAVSALSSLRQRTFRTLIQIPMGGNTVRLTYSNEYSSDNELLIGEITLANGQAGDVDRWASGAKMVPIKGKELRTYFAAAKAAGDVEFKNDYYGNLCVAIKPGHQATTGEIKVDALGLEAMDYVSVSTWVCNMTDFDDGITGGLIGGLTHYLGIGGLGSAIGYDFNHTEVSDLTSVGVVSPVELANSDATGDYNIIPFLKEIDVKRSTITGVDKTTDAYTTVIFGDSTLANNIPLLLENRLLANNVQGVSFVWSAIKGNEFLLNGQSSVSDNDKNGPAMGESGLNRAYKDALNLPGVKKIIVKLGINDILHPYCTNMQGDYGDYTTAKQLIAAYKQFIDMAHDKGIEVYFYELTPWNGYTRNGKVNYSESIDAVRKEVNSWLAKYGKAYDDFATIGRDTNSNDGYTGTVKFNNNYGDASHTQDCDKVYLNSPTSVNGPKSYSHDQSFDTFGYISLDALNGENDGIMQSKYTTDGIHFSSIGQNKVANSTPLSIFKLDKEVSQAGQSVVIPNVFVASTVNQLVDGKYYYISNTEGSATTHNSSQENSGVLATAPNYQTTGVGNYDMDYHEDFGSNQFKAKLHLTDTAATIQRGVSTAPYIIGTGVDDAAQWQTLKKNGTWYWLNSGTERYLAWYYPGAKYGALNQIYRFTTGTVETDPDNESSFFGQNAGWYTFTNVEAADNNLPYSVYLLYDGKASKKYFTYGDRSVDGTSKNTNVWAAIHTSYVSKTPVTLYVNTNGEIKAEMDLKAPTAWGTEVEKDTYVVDSYKSGKDFDSVYYVLKDNMPNASGATEEYTNDGESLGNKPDGNGQFNGYTYGTAQAMYWKSSDETVATVSQDGKVNVTGEPGISTITLNFFWQEFNELYKNNAYVWDNNNGQYYTEDQMNELVGSTKPTEANGKSNGYHWVEIENGKWVYTNYNYLTSSIKIKNVTDYSTDIVIDGNLVDDYTISNVINGTTSSLEALYITNPNDVEYLPGHWVWTSSDTSVATISATDAEFATLKYTGKTGSTTVTATYYDDNGPVEYNGKPITSSVKVNAEEKPLAIDVKVNDKITDYYYNHNSNKNDSVSMEAFVEAPYEGHNSGTYSWKVYDLNGKESNNVIALDTATGKNVTAKVLGEGAVAVIATYIYKDSNGNDKSVSSAVYFDIAFGVHSNSIVLDFGLAANIDLAKYIDPDYSASGISATAPAAELLTEKTASDEFNAAKSAVLTYGDATLNENVLTYTPKSIAQGIDTVYYSADVKDGYKYAKLDVIPASSVYYEDSFVNFDGNWQPAGTEITGKFQNVNDNAYGYDAAYGEYNTYSMGSAQYVTVNNEYGANLPTYTGEYPTATFTFTGTGFAVYSTSDNDAGYVSVKYTNSKGETVKKMVNAYANGDYDQTPTVQYLNLPYDTYSVTLTVVYDKSFDGNNDGHYTYYLDAIRIYSPMGDNQEAQNAYAEVGEANASFQTIRSMLISKDTFGTIKDAVSGAVFLDSTDLEANVSNYKNYGPKNEVYLGNGQGVAFTLENAASFTDVQIGIKQAGAASGQVTVNDKVIDLNSATDMYYSIKDVIGADGRVVIVNTGSGLISLTVLKTTAANPVAVNAMVDAELGDFAAAKIMSYMTTPVEPTTEPSTEPTTEPTVEPSEEPEPSEDPRPSEDPLPSEAPEPSEDPQPGDDDSDKDSPIVGFFKKIGNFFKNLFGGWKR